MAKTNVWMSVSDLMTGLMVVFLFVSIAYMMKANQLIKENENKLKEYVDTKNRLHEELQKEFDKQIGDSTLAINNDLSMRFAKAESLFENGQSTLSQQFDSVLHDVMPVYFQVLLNDSLRPHIKEVRIEGHTDTKPFGPMDNDPYLSNLRLSQERAREMVKCVREICAENFDEADQLQLDKWLTSVGYSYTHALDAEGNYVSQSGKPIDMDRSKRVEIRIITDDNEVLEGIVKSFQSEK